MLLGAQLPFADQSIETLERYLEIFPKLNYKMEFPGSFLNWTVKL